MLFYVLEITFHAITPLTPPLVPIINLLPNINFTLGSDRNRPRATKTCQEFGNFFEAGQRLIRNRWDLGVCTRNETDTKRLIRCSHKITTGHVQPRSLEQSIEWWQYPMQKPLSNMSPR